MKNLVTIKGKNKGLVLYLDDQCAYADLLAEVAAKVSDPALDSDTEVTVHLNKRYCTDSQIQELSKVVSTNPHLKVIATTSDILTVQESEQKILESQSETYVGIVRSGQVIKAEGDLVVIGDVNPNGRVEAGGSVYVLGRLKGAAHAGTKGNRDAVIAASWLEATQLKIHDELETMTDELSSLSEQPEMECAYLHTNGTIIIDRLQELRFIRPQISTFKGGS
ncbi:septum site-determining protein MinC [Planococcus kocurii]|uniref:septum site-determining protein MinC n=1 Tax=Planococcus kocurii TaxID=1374 RepID=UPI0009E743D3